MTQQQPLMASIRIAGIDRPVSKLIQGSMMLSEDRMTESADLLDAYVAVGGNAIDTAHVYGASGAKALGRWMQERGNRADLVLIGKGAHPNEFGPRMTYEAMKQDLHESLDRLQTDHLDVYKLHRDDPNKSVGYILESLNALIEAKQCRALGASNWTIARIAEANEYAAAHGLIGFACNSPNLSLAKPNEPRWEGCVSAGAADIAWHEQSQLPLLSWSSQAGGFFTGRFAPDRLEDKEAVRVYYSDANWERLRRARLLAERKGCDANHIALAYVLRQRYPTCAIIGPANPSELRSSLPGLEVSVTEAEADWLDLKPGAEIAS
ncbi:aldo/keto reductase [Cohnella sp. GCM10027633]|uniref:aldo/keto reductase n=1 Tax=unclassified Cohnella TaxID=2636738 RepID=UPI00364135E2